MKKKSGTHPYLKTASILAVTSVSALWGSQTVKANEVAESMLPSAAESTAEVNPAAANEISIALPTAQEIVSPGPSGMHMDQSVSAENQAQVAEAEPASIVNNAAGNQAAVPASQTVNQAARISISGNTHIGETLTAQLSDADGMAPEQISYQWYANTEAIPRATEASFTLTADEIGKQLNVEANYRDASGHLERAVSDYTAAITTHPVSVPQPPVSAELPTLSIEGPAVIKEGERASYTVHLSRPADQDISVDISLLHGETTAADLAVRHNLKRVEIKKGETKTVFRVNSKTDGLVEGNESFRLSLTYALAGSVKSTAPAQTDTVSAQSLIIPAYKYPEMWKADPYWQAVHTAGGTQVPFVVINPQNGAGQTVDSNYTKLLTKNRAAGIQSIAYINTLYGSRSLTEVKEEVHKYFAFYGQDNINGFFFDEVDSRSNQQTLYMAELYNYVKALSSDLLIIANPGAAITDAIAPYADIFVASEVSAETYLNEFTQPTSAFENTSSNAKHLMHMVHSASTDQYQKIIELSRNRNAGWLFITSDSSAIDNNPYDDLPENFAALARQINSLGMPVDPRRGVQTLPKAAGLGADSTVTTIIIDIDSPETDVLLPKSAEKSAEQSLSESKTPEQAGAVGGVTSSNPTVSEPAKPVAELLPEKRGESAPQKSNNEEENKAETVIAKPDMLDMSEKFATLQAILSPGPSRYEGPSASSVSESAADRDQLRIILSPVSVAQRLDKDGRPIDLTAPAGHDLTSRPKKIVQVILTPAKDPWAFTWLFPKLETASQGAKSVDTAAVNPPQMASVGAVKNVQYSLKGPKTPPNSSSTSPTSPSHFAVGSFIGTLTLLLASLIRRKGSE